MQTDKRDKKGKFIKGAKAAEKWTTETVTEILEKMLFQLSTNDDGELPENKNIIRSNDIKLIQEICLMNDIDPDLWAYWKEKFKKNKPISRLIKKILWILEARLIYSGQMMDLFVMKNHYGYADKTEVKHDGNIGGATPIIKINQFIGENIPIKTDEG